MTLKKKFLITFLIAIPLTLAAVKWIGILSMTVLAPLYFVLAKRYFEKP